MKDDEKKFKKKKEKRKKQTNKDKLTSLRNSHKSIVTISCLKVLSATPTQKTKCVRLTQILL